MLFYSPKLYLRDWWITGSLLVAVFLQIFMWWYLIANIHPTSEQFFLHYNIIFGIDLLGSWWRIFYLPAGGLLLLLVNLVASWLIYGSEKLLSRVLAITTAFLHIGLLLALWLIVGLNI